jgi:N-glycosylase/DNA lyase
MRGARNEAGVVLAGLAGLDFERTLFGGQAFRWRRAGDGESPGAEGWIGDRPVRVALAAEGLAVAPLDGRVEGLEAAAARYFDAARDYEAAERRLRRDARLGRLATGIRILRQPPFETLVTFVVSANNNIPRIARSVERLCGLAGREVAPGLAAFPEPAALAALGAARLRGEANLGYRDAFVAETARLVASGEVDLDALDRLPTPELTAALGRLPGVGPKVAACVALFGYGRLEVFPVDTWVRRAFRDLYLGGEAAGDREIERRARRRFGPWAGLAQQYLFEAYRRRDPLADARGSEI